MGLIIGAIIALLIIIVFVVYGIPLIRQAIMNGNNGMNINVQLPNPTDNQNTDGQNGGQTP